ncbi:MAG: hypothetical protein K8R52_03610 [Bacteroidales bacterium]|nr:hypothetical protein [Bacteroidales bacterium]
MKSKMNVGKERTIGCVAGFGSTMHAPGKVEMTSGGEFIIGNWNLFIEVISNIFL